MEREDNLLTPICMLEHALEILSESRSAPFEHPLKYSLLFHIPRQTPQSRMLEPPTFTRAKPLVDHSADVEGLNFHPRQGFVVVARPVECARQDRSMSHHIFFHLNEDGGRMVRYICTQRGTKGVGTHELIPDELFPFLVLSFGGDQGSVSFQYPLQPDVSLAGPFEHI